MKQASPKAKKHHPFWQRPWLFLGLSVLLLPYAGEFLQGDFSGATGTISSVLLSAVVVAVIVGPIVLLWKLLKKHVLN